jgi:mannose-6-phosphate isomerase-like protein (cupin superfamily)
MAINIERITLLNTHYRRVLVTNKHQQVVVMSLRKGEEIEMETHNGSQFFRIEKGRAVATVGSKRCLLKEGSALVVPAGVPHRVVATTDVKLYTIYSPPQHTVNGKSKD